MAKVVLVGSVKGGTGKTLFSINLALELASRGRKVYLLDADITSSYFKRFTGAEARPVVDHERVEFAEWRGIRVFSLSLLDEGPVSMFGFSERQLIEDIFRYSDWRSADVLIIDLPAGAEDVFKEALRLWARWIAGLIVVGIPFAERSMRHLLEMARYYELPVIGLVENMAYLDCRHCGGEGRLHVFGEPRGRRVAEEYGVPFLGEIPLDPRVYEAIERGDPRLPGDIRVPVERAAELVEEARPGSFWESWKRRARGYLQGELVKLAASILVAINRSFNIREMRKRYGFKGGNVFSLVITDSEGKPLVVLNLKLLDDRLVIVKGRVKPRWVIEMPVQTLVDIVRGYRQRGGQRLPFDVRTAWRLGELKVYGPGASTLALYVAETLFGDPEVLEQARRRLGSVLSLLGG